MMTRAWIWAWTRIRALAGDDRGATMVEYAVLIAVAILIVVVAFRNFSDAFMNVTNSIADQLGDAVNSST